jgi:hypothetical protein
MERALPRLKHQFYLPANRRDLEDRGGLPNRLGHIGDQEMPGQQRQMRGGRWVAFFLGVFPGHTPPCIHHLFWDTRGNQASRHLRFGSDQEGLLQERALDHGQATGQLHRGDPVGHCFQQGRLMVKATEKIGVGGGNRGQRFDLEIASIKQKQVVVLG